MNNNKVAAVVVTFNRIELLKKVINGLRKQTHKLDYIVVVNNSSTDGSEEWLLQQKDLTVVKQENIGSSGGQYTGSKTAFGLDTEWIWIMDDDVVAQPDCLEILMKYAGEQNLITAPLRHSSPGEAYLNDTLKLNLTNPFKSIWTEIFSPKYLEFDTVKAEGITFEGPLIHRSVFEKVGFPERNFFIYADDTEFFVRCIKIGIVPLLIKNANLLRMIPVTGPDYVFTWKQYYIIRNIIAIDVMHGSYAVRLMRPFAYLIKWLGRSKSLANVKTVLKAFADGYFYKPYKEN